MNLDFEDKKSAILYDMYVKFQKTYYGYNNRDVYITVYYLSEYFLYTVHS